MFKKLILNTHMKNNRLLSLFSILIFSQKATYETERKLLLRRTLINDDFLNYTISGNFPLQTNNLHINFNIRLKEMILDYQIRDKIKNYYLFCNKTNEAKESAQKNTDTNFRLNILHFELHQDNNKITTKFIDQNGLTGQETLISIAYDVITKCPTPVPIKNTVSQPDPLKQTFLKSNKNDNVPNNCGIYDFNYINFKNIENLIKNIFDSNLFFNKILGKIDKETRKDLFKQLSKHKNNLNLSTYPTHSFINALDLFKKKI